MRTNVLLVRLTSWITIPRYEKREHVYFSASLKLAAADMSHRYSVQCKVSLLTIDKNVSHV